jgi:hypothetical protein
MLAGPARPASCFCLLWDLGGQSRLRSLWWAVAIVLLLPLGGCFADQQQQLASCKVDAMRLYPDKSPFISYTIEEYVTRCMEMHGYNYSSSLSACVAPTKDDPRCWAPTSWIGRLIYRLETGD